MIGDVLMLFGMLKFNQFSKFCSLRFFFFPVIRFVRSYYKQTFIRNGHYVGQYCDPENKNSLRDRTSTT